ncbi:MAG TPA: hypothetical protein VG275_08380 [Solirubrobacteraceae bacterium]|jgi:hypothetical protein|nr:hypothetical protein [Solirubrobacteraceae bacterium]
MPEPAHVLVVAHQTASTSGLMDAVRARSERGPATFHLVVPQRPHGMHKYVDPHDDGVEEAQAVLTNALPKLSAAAGAEVTGRTGDPEPLMAIHDAVNLGHYDEIIISTLPRRVSKWLHLDLVSKARGLGLPVTHVEAQHAPDDGRARQPEAASTGGR